MDSISLPTCLQRCGSKAERESERERGAERGGGGDWWEGGENTSASVISEDQYIIFRELGISVPSHSLPRGVTLGDGYCTRLDVHCDVFRMEGEAFGMRYLFLCHTKDRWRCEWARDIEASLLPIHEILSNWNDASSLSLLNSSLSLPSPPPLLLHALSLSAHLHRRSQGRYDIAMGRVTSLWSHTLDHEGHIPTQDQIDAILCHRLSSAVPPNPNCEGSLYSTVVRGDASALSLSPYVSLDLNSLAKGAGVDSIARFMRERNVENYYFDWSGEIVSRGRHASGRMWTTCVPSPPSLSDLYTAWRTSSLPPIEKPLCLIQLSPPDSLSPSPSPSLSSSASSSLSSSTFPSFTLDPQCVFVATSGDYFQSKKYGFFHIVDPHTGSSPSLSVSLSNPLPPSLSLSFIFLSLYS
jgi:thiamine biosynthesis lipoprotein ApbE